MRRRQAPGTAVRLRPSPVSPFRFTVQRVYVKTCQAARGLWQRSSVSIQPGFRDQLAPRAPRLAPALFGEERPCSQPAIRFRATWNGRSGEYIELIETRTSFVSPLRGITRFEDTARAQKPP